MGWLNAPGARFPVSSLPSLSTTRCVVVSMLCHTTVCPVGTVAGFGENDWLPFSRTTLMVIAAAGGGVSLGADGDEVPYPPPHAVTPNIDPARLAAKKNLRMMLILSIVSYTAVGVAATVTNAAFICPRPLPQIRSRRFRPVACIT